MIVRRWYVSTGFRHKYDGRTFHILAAIHRRWRLAFVRPYAKADYRRLYVGPFEFEWSLPIESKGGMTDD